MQNLNQILSVTNQNIFYINSLGDRIIEITAVDVRLNQLMNAWLVYASVKSANIAKSYQITIPIGSQMPIIKVSIAHMYTSINYSE
jgi:hypothetical protein